jgi:hypothetical protein
MISNMCIEFQLVSKLYCQWTSHIDLRWYTNFNVNFKSKKGHNSVKILDRVTTPFLPVKDMMVNKSVQFESHMSIDFEHI